MGVSPEPSSREAAVRLLGLLSVMDTHMSNRKDAQLGWLEISIALGLDSTRGKTITMIASEVGLSKQGHFQKGDHLLTDEPITSGVRLKIGDRQTGVSADQRPFRAE